MAAMDANNKKGHNAVHTPVGSVTVWQAASRWDGIDKSQRAKRVAATKCFLKEKKQSNSSNQK